MKFTETKLKGAFIIELEPFKDLRGSFARTFCANEFAMLEPKPIDDPVTIAVFCFLTMF